MMNRRIKTLKNNKLLGSSRRRSLLSSKLIMVIGSLTLLTIPTLLYLHQILQRHEHNVLKGRVTANNELLGPDEFGSTAKVYWIWGVDADVPPETTLMLESIINDESVEKLHIYCGTRQCYETIVSMEVISQQADLIQLNFLRVPDVSHRTRVLNTYLASQEMLAILRLQLPGLSFEHFIQLGSILAVLEQSIAVSKKGRHIYLDPLMPTCAAKEVLSLPSSDGVQIIYSEEDSSAPNYMTQLSWVRAVVVDNVNTGALTQAVSALESLLYRPRGEELVVEQLSDDWERAICNEDGLSCIPILRAVSRSKSCANSLLSRSLAIQLTSHFYLPGYGSHAGCPGQPGQSLRQLYEFAEGDVYQTLAALQFLPRVDNFIDVNVGYPSFDEVMHMPNREWKKGSHSIVCEHTEKCRRRYGEKLQSESLDGCLINDSFSGWSNKWPGNPGNNGLVYFITAARWFEHFDEGTAHSWPPPHHIKPIFVGHRIEKTPSENMLQWMRKHQEETNTAVGARDTYSQGLLCKSGINAMFTGDLTLGLRDLLDSHSHVGIQAESDLPVLVFTPDHATSGIRLKTNDKFLNSTLSFVDHHWQLNSNSSIRHLGRIFDLVNRPHRFQIAVETLRHLQFSKGGVTTKQFHVIIPSLGLNKSLAYYGETDNRLSGYEQVLPKRSIDRDEAIIALIREGVPSKEAEALRRKLVIRARTILAKESPSFLDTMHRLGPHSVTQNDDDAWKAGRLPSALLEGLSNSQVEQFVNTTNVCD